MICPTCGEDNSDNFRFCGMCGTLLEARRPAGAPVPSLQSAVPPPVPATMANAPEPLRPPVMENGTKPVLPISGPSMLGLNQPDANQSRSNLMSPNLPSMDLLRETAFSGLDSFFEPERPKGGGRRILLMVALLAALGGAGWWTYTNYLGAGESRKPEVATSSTGEASTEKPSTKAAAPAADPALDAGSSQAAVPPMCWPRYLEIGTQRAVRMSNMNSSWGARSITVERGAEDPWMLLLDRMGAIMMVGCGT